MFSSPYSLDPELFADQEIPVLIVGTKKVLPLILIFCTLLTRGAPRVIVVGQSGLSVCRSVYSESVHLDGYSTVFVPSRVH